MTRRDELCAASILLLLGLGGTVEALKLTVGKPASPGPGFFPFFLALALSLTSLALVLRSLGLLERKEATTESSGALPRREKVAWTFFGLFVYAFVLEGLGFIPATFLLLLLLFRIIDPIGWPAAIGGSLATSLLTYLLFSSWLQVRLPPGPWAP